MRDMHVRVRSRIRGSRGLNTLLISRNQARTRLTSRFGGQVPKGGGVGGVVELCSKCILAKRGNADKFHSSKNINVFTRI